MLSAISLQLSAKKRIKKGVMMCLPIPKGQERNRNLSTKITEWCKISTMVKEHNILIVDDNKDFADVFRDILKVNNCKLESCYGAKVLGLLQTGA